MTLGKTLRDLRQRNQGTLAKFADKIGISQGQLSRLERDFTGSVDASLLRRISHTYQIGIEDILDLLDSEAEHAE